MCHLVLTSKTVVGRLEAEPVTVSVGGAGTIVGKLAGRLLLPSELHLEYVMPTKKAAFEHYSRGTRCPSHSAEFRSLRWMKGSFMGLA